MTPRRALLVFLLGWALVSTPLFVQSGAGSDVYRYESYEYESERLPYVFDDVLRCDVTPESRECFLERRVAANGGTLRLNSTDADDGDELGAPSYRFVRLDGTNYRPTSTIRNDTVVLHLARVSEQELVDAHTTAFTSVSADTKRVIAEKSVTSRERLDVPTDTYVARNGTYYQLTKHETTPQKPGYVDPLRVFGVPLGLGLVLYSWDSYLRGDEDA